MHKVLGLHKQTLRGGHLFLDDMPSFPILINLEFHEFVALKLNRNYPRER